MAVARKRNYSGGSYVRKFMRAGAAGLRLAMRYRNRGMGSQTATRRKGKEYGNITFQQDERRIYQRRRAPRRVRRAHRRAFNKFEYHLDKVQSMKTAVINDNVVFSQTPTGYANGQLAIGLSLYGYGENSYAANINTANGDMPWIFA